MPRFHSLAPLWLALGCAVLALALWWVQIPFLELSELRAYDLRFRARTPVPVPSSQAVMFCVMDVSGSMDETRKDLAKRFFILLYLFLTRHYETIDIVFIRHHTQAAEVSEEAAESARRRHLRARIDARVCVGA